VLPQLLLSLVVIFKKIYNIWRTLYVKIPVSMALSQLASFCFAKDVANLKSEVRWEDVPLNNSALSAFTAKS